MMTMMNVRFKIQLTFNKLYRFGNKEQTHENIVFETIRGLSRCVVGEANM